MQANQPSKNIPRLPTRSPNRSDPSLTGLEVTVNESNSLQKPAPQIQLSQNMFSQESFKNYMEDSQREAELQKRRLHEKEEARK